MTTAPALSEHSLGPVAQIPEGEGRLFECQGRLLAVFHLRGGDVRATQPRCPHRGGPLADGIVAGTTLVCPLHARRFDLLTGDLVAGDLATGDCVITTYPARLTGDGEIMVVLDPGGRAAAVQG